MRSDALTSLKSLAEELRNSKFVSSDRKWEDELENVCIWANSEGTKSSVVEIDRRIGELKVRHRLIFSYRSIPFHTISLAQLVLEN